MISTYIEKIKTAILGKDVKAAIADGIEQSYKDAINSGNTAAEVQLARGAHQNLGSRLDSTDEAMLNLEEKIQALQNNIILATISEAESVELADGQILIVYEEQVV